MVLFVSSLTKSVLQVILLLWPPKKDFLKGDTRRRSKPKTPGTTENKSTSAGRVAEMDRMFFFFFHSFFFIHPKQKRCCDSFQHFKPTAYRGLRHFKKWNLSLMHSAGVESTSRINPLTYCCAAHTH